MARVRWISAASAGVSLFGLAVGAEAAGAAVPAAGECKAVAVVSARGTTEPQRGSLLQKPIGARIEKGLPGRTSYTELVYPASAASGSADTGVATLVELLNAEVRRCPEQRLVLMGYSQGAWVVGDALVPPDKRTVGKDAGEVSAAVPGRIAAILLFGDVRFTAGEPFNTGTFEPAKQSRIPREKGVLDRYRDRIQNRCNAGDLVCQTTGNWIAHLGYFWDSSRPDAAAFALSKLKNSPNT
ncbi:cutinase family protein [Spirillospora sp. CA-294931]|uniref:cutinase family protein n=1 Tax=Spirillospora sp. CA-294931 TaxID=3240042 RepID=UPI003D92D7C6